MPDDEPLPSSPEYSASPQYPIESVDNALRLLWLVGERRSLRLTDASRYLDVASSTTHRLLAMLQYRGFVRQNAATRAYELGPTLDRIAFSLLRRMDVRERARPVLKQLSADLQETVHLGRLEGSNVLFIDSIESPQAVRVGSRLGRSMPAHCTSTGKAMLAQFGARQLMTLFPEEGSGPADVEVDRHTRRPVQRAGRHTAPWVRHQQRRERGRRFIYRCRAGPTRESADGDQCFGARQPHDRCCPAPHRGVHHPGNARHQRNHRLSSPMIYSWQLRARWAGERRPGNGLTGSSARQRDQGPRRPDRPHGPAGAAGHW